MGLFNKTEERPLTRRRLEKHLVLTIIGGIALNILTGIGTPIHFYYKTNNELENLRKNDIRHDAAFIEVNRHLNDISDNMGDTKTSTAVSDEKIKSLESKLLTLQEQQDLILKTQFDILKLIGDKK